MLNWDSVEIFTEGPSRLGKLALHVDEEGSGRDPCLQPQIRDTLKLGRPRKGRSQPVPTGRGPGREGRLGCAVTWRCGAVCIAARGQKAPTSSCLQDCIPRQRRQTVYSLGMQLSDVGLPKPETC